MKCTGFAAIAFTLLAATASAQTRQIEPVLVGVNLKSQPAINDSGAVAYKQNGQILRYDGASTTIIQPLAAGFANTGIALSMNNAGRVTFYGNPALSSNRGIYAGDGGPITPVAVANGPLPAGSAPDYGENPSIGNDGSIAYQLTNQFNPTLSAAYSNRAGTNNFVWNNNFYDMFHILVDPSVSPNGSIVAYESFDPSNNTFRVNTANIDAPPGGFTPVSKQGGFSSLNVNDAGTVIIAGNVAEVLPGIHMITGDRVSTVTDVSTEFDFFGQVAINNSGQFAFSGAGGTFSGIYTGGNRLTDKVIEVGDALAGSTVVQLEFGRDGLNSSGDIVFWAQLANNTEGIFTSSIPEPTHLILCFAVALLGARRRQKLPK